MDVAAISLSREQREALNEPGSVFLSACPGSGKTRTLTAKIVESLKSCDPTGRRRVLALTYTRRAADEILERLRGRGLETRRLWIGTIHSFCLEWILRPYSSQHPQLNKGFSVIGLHERETLLTEICERFRGKRITHWDCGEFWVPHLGYRLTSTDMSKRPSVNLVLDAYRKQLREQRQVDFVDILRFAFEILESSSVVPKLLFQLFSIVLVDECQDVQQVQFEIVSSILKAGRKTVPAFLVGDPNQAIFDSLGGHPLDAVGLSEMSGLSVKPMWLSGNYRSSARIVEYSSHFCVSPVDVSAVGPAKSFSSHISFWKDLGGEAVLETIVKILDKLVRDKRIPQHEICIAAPSWFTLAAMNRRLSARLPDFSFDGPGVTPIGGDRENFWFGISKIALSRSSPDLFLRRVRWASEALDTLAQLGVGEGRLPDARGLLRITNRISPPDDDGLDYLTSFFGSLGQNLGVVFDDSTELAAQRRAFSESTAGRTERLRNEGLEGAGSIAAFRNMFRPRTGISISTIHGVKGAEFDVVIGFGLLEGRLPHFNEPHPEMAAKKLLYVLSSRARKHLFLFSEVGSTRTGHPLVPTQLLADYDFAYDNLRTRSKKR